VVLAVVVLVVVVLIVVVLIVVAGPPPHSRNFVYIAPTNRTDAHHRERNAVSPRRHDSHTRVTSSVRTAMIHTLT
jgi:uncharacterized protein HemY